VYNKEISEYEDEVKNMSTHKGNRNIGINKTIRDEQLKSTKTQNIKKNSNLDKDQINNAKNRNNSLKQKNSVNNKALEGNLMEQKKNNYIIPIIFILAVLPLIVKIKTIYPMMSQYNWLLDDTNTFDFFLFYKHWFFVAAASIMAIVVLHLLYTRKKAIEFHPIFIPLFIYGILALVSTIFSKYIPITLKGYTDQYESIFAILGYCIVVYYSFLYVKTENDIKKIINYFVIGVFLLIALGISQFAGHDFFASEFGTKLITSFKNPSGLDFVLGVKRVYLTLFNPNYVGVYVSLVLPIFLVLLIFSKKLINSVLYLLVIIGLAVCIIGSQSLSGVVGIGVSIIALLLFLWRYFLRRYYIAIPFVLVAVLVLLVVNKQTDYYMSNKFQSAIKMEKTIANLKEIKTESDRVSFNYKNNVYHIELITDGYTGFRLTDSNNNDIYYTYDEEAESFIVTDERLAGMAFGFVNIGDYLGFYVTIEGVDWFFTNQTGDGSYYLYNRFNKLDKVVNAPSAVFTGYENLASGRGYLWSRSIPLLKKYLVVGSGPNTFVMVFPQQDYVGIHNYGYELLTITKPHNLYLQIAIQTGLLSLIAFLIFYVMYFISSTSLYIKGRFNNYYSQVGVAIFLGTLSYMITGFANDSNIATAPLFWTFIGIGISMNKKAKSIMLEEKIAVNLTNSQE
jgi:hypothetical protein